MCWVKYVRGEAVDQAGLNSRMVSLAGVQTELGYMCNEAHTAVICV